MQEAQAAWQAAIAAADPITDLSILLQVHEAYAALNTSSTSTPTTPESVAARPAAKEETAAPATATGATAAPAAAPGGSSSKATSGIPNGVPEGGAAQRLAPLPLDEPLKGAEPQPVKQAEATVTQLGALAAPTSAPTPSAAATSSASSTAAAAAPAASSAAAGGSGKAMRGFFGSKSGSEPRNVAAKPGVEAAGGPTAATTSSNGAASSSSRSKSPAAAAAAASGNKDDVEEVDCTTTSSSSSKATRHGWNHAPAALGGGGPNGMPPGGPAQIARMMQNSHAINLAVMQVRERMEGCTHNMV